MFFSRVYRVNLTAFISSGAASVPTISSNVTDRLLVSLMVSHVFHNVSVNEESPSSELGPKIIDIKMVVDMT